MKINYPAMPIISAPIFNHHYEANKPLHRGVLIEVLINSHLLKTYKEKALYRLFLNFSKKGKIINVMDNCTVSLLGNTVYPPLHSELHESLILTHLQGWHELSKLNIDLRDKDFKHQFELIKSVLHPKKRLLIKTNIDNHQPDLILDNMIIDVKTHRGGFDLKEFIDQLIRQFIQFQTFINCPNLKSKVDEKILDLILQPVDSVGVYLWKSNQLLSFSISDLIPDHSEILKAIEEVNLTRLNNSWSEIRKRNLQSNA